MPHPACFVLTSLVKKGRRWGAKWMHLVEKKNISLGRLKGALKFFGSTLYAHIAEMSDHRLGEAPCDALGVHC